MTESADVISLCCSWINLNMEKALHCLNKHNSIFRYSSKESVFRWIYTNVLLHCSSRRWYCVRYQLSKLAFLIKETFDFFPRQISLIYYRLLHPTCFFFFFFGFLIVFCWKLIWSYFAIIMKAVCYFIKHISVAQISLMWNLPLFL